MACSAWPKKQWGLKECSDGDWLSVMIKCDGETAFVHFINMLSLSKTSERPKKTRFCYLSLSRDWVFLEDVTVKESFCNNWYKHARIYHSWWSTKAKKSLDWHNLLKGDQCKMERKLKAVAKRAKLNKITLSGDMAALLNHHCTNAFLRLYH